MGTKKVLTQDPTGKTPLYNITGTELFTTYNLWSFNDTIDKESDQYVSRLWVQRTNKRESGIYKGVPCEGLFDREMQSPQFWSQIVNQTCPDFNTSSSIMLQKGNPLN